MTRIVTVGPSGRDYTTLNAAWTGTVSAHTSPVDDSQPWAFELDAFTDTTSATIGNVPTSTTNNITFRAAAGAEHAGVKGAGYVGSPITVNAGNCVFLDLEFRAASNGQIVFDARNLNGPLTVKRCITSTDATTLGSGDGFWPANAEAYFENCLADGPFDIAFVGSAFTDSTFRNCTARESSRGFFRNSSNATVTNCVGFDTVSDDFSSGFSGDYNASEDTSAPGANSITGLTTAAFTDYANGDYTPASGGALDGAGTDLSAFFTDDITGSTRTQWDIGAYGIVGGGGTTVEAGGIQNLANQFSPRLATRLNGWLQ